jgi:hypothetical protein
MIRPRRTTRQSKIDDPRGGWSDEAVTAAEHAWVRWRSLYVDDPEGNTVEWVCYDVSVG